MAVVKLYVVEYKSRRGKVWNPIQRAYRSLRRATNARHDLMRWGRDQFEYRVMVYARWEKQ